MQRTEFSNPEVQRMYTLPGGKNVNVHDVTDIEVCDWDEKQHHRDGGKPCLIIRWQGRRRSGSHYISFRDYETALQTYNETVEAVTRLRCLDAHNGVQSEELNEAPVDLRLAALALHLDEHPANIRKVEEHLYRATLEPDKQGGAPQQVDYFVMTLEEAQTEWESDGDYERFRPGVDLTPIGSYYIFEA